MKMHVFKSATVKLTFTYIAILVGICAFFSINWYRFATSELNEALRRQSAVIERIPDMEATGMMRSVLEAREERLKESKRNIARQLLGVNILLLLMGGLGSYYMAKRTLEPIEVAHQAQTQFTADASHELRTPLATMQTEIEVALRDASLSKHDAIAMLRSNLEEIARLQSLSEGLLRLARQGSDAVVLVPVSLDLIFKQVRHRIAPYAALKNITVQWPTSAPTVLADAVSLEELLTNLVDNAIKYSDHAKSVTVSWQRIGGQCIIRVIDQGAGIAKTDLPHIFERFYRADQSRTSQQRQGHGLGLSIAQSIARIHGAELSVVSELGKGSAFSFALRVVDRA